MAKTAQKTPKNIQINESVMFSYWNQNEWEFAIDPRNISKEAANRYQALATMLTMQFCNRPIRYINKEGRLFPKTIISAYYKGNISYGEMCQKLNVNSKHIANMEQAVMFR